MNFKRFAKEARRKKWFITGGAGFIGSFVVDLLVSAGARVTVYDNLSSGNFRWVEGHVKKRSIRFYKNDVRNIPYLKNAMKGHDIVWHFAANTDIPTGYKNRRKDLEHDAVATWSVLEAMLKNNMREILFASTGAVYGETIKGTFHEHSGPLIPVSLYGAGKISSEAFISAYCSLFRMKAWIFRFGNVIGSRISHGAVYDFVQKLKKTPKTLEILGRGIGKKNYFLVEECINGMLFTYQELPRGPFPVIINLGSRSTTKVMQIAKTVIEEMGLSNVKYRFTGTKRSWPGDQPIVLLDTSRIRKLGWHTARTSSEAVRIATRRLLGKEKFSLTIDTEY